MQVENRDISKCWYEKVCKQNKSKKYCANINSCIRYAEMNYLMDTSDIPTNRQFPDKLDASEDYKSFCKLADIKDDIIDFVQSGNNLVITSGNTGNGKTSWAIKLLMKYFDSIWLGNGFRTRGKFVHIPTLLLQLKNFNSPVSDTYKDELMNCDLVVWDDLASVDATAYDYSQLLLFIDNRINNQKSNIFTTNQLSEEEMEERLGTRLASRIWNTSEIIIFKGKDRRKA